MREFADIQHEPGLKRFSDSLLGTLYMILDDSQVPRVMVRHFDNELPPTLVEPFADFVHATQQWLERHLELARLVRVEQPSEVGRDFIARPFHVYYTSTSIYEDWDNPLESPEELEQMRSAFGAAIGKSADPQDVIIETVLARSLLEPTGKTYFGDSEMDKSEGQFIVVEPKLTLEDVECWAALSALSASTNT